MRYFHFIAPDVSFNKELQTRQCAFTKTNGHQCKNKVQMGLPYCWIHRKLEQHLLVQQSTIPNAGLGVFAIDIKKEANAVLFRPTPRGQPNRIRPRICFYDGEVISEATLLRRYGKNTAPYAVQTRKNNNSKFEDGPVRRSIGSLFNHKNSTGANCALSTNNQSKAIIVADKIIRNGDELFINYGNHYRFNEADVNTATNRRKRF